MKAFTVNQHFTVQLGIQWSQDPFPCVRLGEAGRGRILTLFPVGKKFVNGYLFEKMVGEEGEEPRPIMKCSVLKTKSKGTLLLVEEREDDTKRAIVLVQIHGGYRGSNVLETPEGSVLAKGHCAEGEAGRVGGPHTEALVILKPGEEIVVRRFGRYTGGGEVHLIQWDGHHLLHGPQEILGKQHEINTTAE